MTDEEFENYFNIK